MKYAQYLPEQNRRESFNEIIERVETMYTSKVPEATWPLRVAFKYVREGKLLPSMRAMHFAGEGIEQNNARVYNCAATNIETSKDVADVMYLLLSGCGVGVGLEQTNFHREASSRPTQIFSYVVPDSIEGWAESFQILLDCWKNGEQVEFNYDDIRPKGAPITSINALAPGPAGLKEAHLKAMGLIKDKLVISSTLMLRFICIMASAVMSGGIRRSALIGIVDRFDLDSQRLKQDPEWFSKMPELQYMNISVGWREMFRPTSEEFSGIFQNALNYGEPGFFNFGEKEWLTNPCAEIVLKPNQFCNLVEVNAMSLTPENQDEIFQAAALLGFVQSRFSDFKFLSEKWKKVTEKDRLVGVSLTGIAGISEDVNLRRGSDKVKATLDALNDTYGEGTDVPRWTTVKPAGHTSLLFDTASGIHSYPAPFYLRRITVEKSTVLGHYLKNILHPDLLEESFYDPSCWKLVLPLKAAPGADCQTDDGEAFLMLERIKKINKEWIDHGLPQMTNSISATVSIPAGQEEDVLKELYKGTGVHHKGVTVLRQFDTGHDQPVWEPCSEEKYREMLGRWPMFLSTNLLRESRNNTDLGGEIACSGAGGCEVT